MTKLKDIEIIHEDDDILALNKPAGLLTIPDRFNYSLPALSVLLKENFENIFIVHRLDKDTSGVIIFAKNAEAHRDISIQFEKQLVKKLYHAVVQGIVPKDHIEVDIPLIQNPGKGGGVLPSVRGKESLSILNVLQRYKTATLLEVNLVTGRQHQLRAHVASIGHPLLIDDLYGENTEFLLSSIKRNFNLKKNAKEFPIISRITMHSRSIEFIHPTTKENLLLTADYPKDFRVLVSVLEKYSLLG